MSETLAETVDETIVDTSTGAETAVEETPGAVETTDTVVDAPAPQTAEPDWNDIETLRAAASHLERLGFQVQQAPQPEPATAPEVLPPDPWERPDTYAEDLERWNASQLSQALAPMQQFFREQQEAQTDAAIGGLLSTVADEFKLNLDADGQRVFRALADGFAGEGAQRFPFSGAQAAQYAAQQAAQWLTARDKAQSDSGVLAYRKSLGEIADTPAEPGISGGGVTIEQAPKTYDEIIAKHVSRLG